jgi:hypothetical protein
LPIIQVESFLRFASTNCIDYADFDGSARTAPWPRESGKTGLTADSRLGFEKKPGPDN